MKTISEAIETKWDTPGDGNKASDVRVLARFYKWTDKADHKQGFTQLGEIDLTGNLRRGSLPGITEEIENDIDSNEAAYGTIKASQINLEFVDETGTVYKKVLTEDDTDHLYQYFVAGGIYAGWNVVHKWSLVIKIGDAASDNWIEFEYIYGWLFDPDNQDVPRWAGVGEPTPQKFDIAAYSLLKWMRGIESKFLTDMSNPICKYTGGEVDGGAFSYAAGNYPLPPVTREILNESGVSDDNIKLFRMPPLYVSDDKQFSTMLYGDKGATEDAPDAHIPDPFFWKTVTDDDGNTWSYEVFTWGFMGNILLYVSATCKETSEEKSETLNLQAINSNIPEGKIRRMWYGGTGDTFYTLIQEAGGQFRILKITIGGTIGSIADNTTILISGEIDILNDIASYEQHWGLVDLNQADSRLYGLVYRSEAGAYYSKLGYWGVTFTDNGAGTQSWTTIYTTSYAAGDFYTNKYPVAITPAVLTGFRAVRASDGTVGIAFFIFHVVSGEARLEVGAWDSGSGANPQFAAYDTSGYAPFKLEWNAWPLINGRGSIGGFSKVVEEVTYFFFPLTSHQGWNGSNPRKDYWAKWQAGITPSDFLEACTETYDWLYRSFSSHGSTDIDHCTGWLGSARAVHIDSRDYKIFLMLGQFWVHADGTLDVHKTNFLAAGDDNEWPILSAPSITCDTGFSFGSRIANTQHYRPFILYKGYVDSEDETRNRSFLIISSSFWLPNFSFDFYSENPSLADVLKDIAKALGLLMKLGHDTTIIRPRNDIADADKVITPALYIRNAQKIPQVLGYDRVELTTNTDGSVHEAGKTGSMARVLSVDTDFVLPDRGDKRASELYDAWKDNKLKIVLDCRNQSLLEPGDIVDLHLIIPPGGKDYTDGEDAVNAIVIRITNKGMRTQLEAISVDAASSIPV